MASKNLVLKGATWNGVESVDFPVSGGGTARYVETSDADATAADIASGKKAYVNGSLVTGTGSGGGSSYTLIASEEFTVNTTSTSNITVGTIQAGSSAYTSDKMLYVKIRDKAGQRIEHFYGTDCFFANQYPKASSTNNASNSGKLVYYVNQNGYIGVAASAYGVYAQLVDRYGDITIYARYSSSTSRTIDGTFKCDVYLLDWPNGDTPFVPQIVE